MWETAAGGDRPWLPPSGGLSWPSVHCARGVPSPMGGAPCPSRPGSRAALSEEAWLCSEKHVPTAWWRGLGSENQVLTSAHRQPPGSLGGKGRWWPRWPLSASHPAACHLLGAAPTVTAAVVPSLGTPSCFRPPEPTRWGPHGALPAAPRLSCTPGGECRCQGSGSGWGGTFHCPAAHWAGDPSVACGQVGGHS